MSRVYPDPVFEQSLAMEGELKRFWVNDRNGTVEYDSTTQIPVDNGTIVSEWADTLDFTTSEAKRLGNIITNVSKKLILRPGTDLKKGDAVIDASNKEIFKINFVFDYKQRDQFVVEPLEDGEQH